MITHKQLTLTDVFEDCQNKVFLIFLFYCSTYTEESTITSNLLVRISFSYSGNIQYIYYI